MPETSTPGGIMEGGGDVSVEVDAGGETRPAEPSPAPAPATPQRMTRERCIARGNTWTDDAGGACFDYSPPAPPREQHPDEPPAPDPRPEERTGRQEPEPDHSHRVVNPTASGGGSHSGKDGSKTQAGSDGVIEFDSGSNAIQTRAKNQVVEMLNNIRALTDPYNENRQRCMENKRLVE